MFSALVERDRVRADVFIQARKSLMNVRDKVVGVPDEVGIEFTTFPGD